MTISIEYGGDRRLTRPVEDGIKPAVQTDVASWTDVLIKVFLA